MMKNLGVIRNFDPGTILAKMAISAVDPSHNHALLRSCYAEVARGMRHGIVKDTDHVVLVGFKSNVHHSFIERDGVPVVDSLAEGGHYDREAGLYYTDATALSENGRAFSDVARLSYACFKEQFSLDKLDVGEGLSFPPFIG